uniref:Uncharacterized protein n=1 Tax=Leersia perrieri TaxID=77586 RepID=A0A0D9VCP6_9ORYZ
MARYVDGSVGTELPNRQNMGRTLCSECVLACLPNSNRSSNCKRVHEARRMPMHLLPAASNEKLIINSI